MCKLKFPAGCGPCNSVVAALPLLFENILIWTLSVPKNTRLIYQFVEQIDSQIEIPSGHLLAQSEDLHSDGFVLTVLTKMAFGVSLGFAMIP